MSDGGRSNSTMMSLERDSGISDPGDDEHHCQTFENRLGLSQDLRFLSGMPEFCDVLFLVGEEREPIYGVKAILAIRSRVFFKMLHAPKQHVSGSNQRSNSKRLSGISNSLSNLFQRDLHHSNGVQNGPSTSASKTVIEINDFEPDVFKQLLEYIHTGSVVMKTRTLLGLINAAEHFGIEDLRRACADFSHKCINLDTVCPLLVTAERYIQYKSTKNFIQKVLEFVDGHSEQVLKLQDIVHLPLHVMELILNRCDSRTSHLSKYRSADRWCRHYTLDHPEKSYRQLMVDHFVKYISFHLIPTPVLMREVRHLNIISDQHLMTSLAYQADPRSLSPLIMRQINPQGKSNTTTGTPVQRKTSFTSTKSTSSDSDYQEILTDKRLTVVHIDYEDDEAYSSAGRTKSCLNLNETNSIVDNSNNFKF